MRNNMGNNSNNGKSENYSSNNKQGSDRRPSKRLKVEEDIALSPTVKDNLTNNNNSSRNNSINSGSNNSTAISGLQFKNKAQIGYTISEDVSNMSGTTIFHICIVHCVCLRFSHLHY